MLRRSLLLVAAAVFLWPFVVMALLSLQGTAVVADMSRLTLASYRDALATPLIGRWLINSVVVASLSAVGAVVVSSMAGYAFAKRDTPAMRVAFWVCMAGMIVPRQTMLISLYGEMVFYGLLGTVVGMVAPVVAMPLALFLFRQYAKTIPDSYIEAAWMDGAKEITVYARVIAPLMIPAMGVVALLYFVTGWNDYNWQLLVSTVPETYTFPVAISAMARGEFMTDHGLTMAAAVLGTLPVAGVFIATRKTLMQGLNLEGV